MATTPVSIEQFGATIKAKHPEYADLSDADVANKVLAKFPQYHDMVDISANPKGEGVYQMRAQDGKPVGVPYSAVSAAEGQGHFFTNRQELDRYSKDRNYAIEQNDPHMQALTPTAGGIAKGALDEAGNMIKGGASLFGPPTGPGEAIAGPAAPIYRMVKGYGQSATTGLKQAASYAQNGQPVRAAATAVGAVNPLSSGPTASINAKVDQGAPISEVIGQGVTDAGVLAAPELAKVAAPVVSKVAGKTAVGLYRNALKPPPGSMTAAESTAKVQTGLDYSLPVSAAGVEKLGDLVDDFNNGILSELKSAPKRPIDPNAVATRADAAKARFSNQVNAQGDLNAIEASRQQFLDEQGRTPAVPPKPTGLLDAQGRPIMTQGTPAQPAPPMNALDAQEMKQGTYAILRKKYGEQGSAAVEAQKALARGLKEEIAVQFPEIGKLNAAESRLLDLGPTLERAVNRISNNHTIGIGGPIMAGGIKAATNSTGLASAVGLMKSIFDIPAIKSQVAIALSKGAKIPYPTALARVSAYQASLGSAVSGSQGYSSSDSSNQPAQ